MKLKQVSFITFLLGILLCVAGFVAPIIAFQNRLSQGGATGIVGGADAPTYNLIVFRMMGGWPFCAILFGIALVLSALFCLIFSKTVRNTCNLKTTAISLGLSAVGAMGLVCFWIWFAIVAFWDAKRYPIAYPASLILGMTCFLLFIVLIGLYFKIRKSIWSVKGFCIDVLTSIAYLPPFFFAFYFLSEMLR